MTIPNFITVARFLSVPAIVYFLLEGRPVAAFVLFVIAGASDGVDGFIARHFDQKSQLGTYLDPIADKLLLVAVFIMLGLMERLPDWLVVIVVSRDVLIVLAVILSSLMDHPVEMRPILVSKANTACQIVLATLVMADLAFAFDFAWIETVLIYLVLTLTVLSAGTYLRDWLRHMARAE